MTSFFVGSGPASGPLVVGNYRMVSRNELGLGGARPACAWQQGVVTCEGSRFATAHPVIVINCFTEFLRFKTFKFPREPCSADVGISSFSPLMQRNQFLPQVANPSGWWRNGTWGVHA